MVVLSLVAGASTSAWQITEVQGVMGMLCPQLDVGFHDAPSLRCHGVLGCLMVQQRGSC